MKLKLLKTQFFTEAKKIFNSPVFYVCAILQDKNVYQLFRKRCYKTATAMLQLRLKNDQKIIHFFTNKRESEQPTTFYLEI